MSFSNEELLDMYSDMVNARVMGEQIIEYIKSGRIAGAIHPSIGQEAISAGVIQAFKKSPVKKNYGTCTHRSQRISIWRMGWKPFVGELLGRSTGVNSGVSGEYHTTDIDGCTIPATGALGGTWGILAGVAWALKQQGRKDEICFAPYGDGAVQEGATYEAMNIATLYKLPILFFVENNQIAMSTPTTQETVLENISDRAAAFNMRGVTVDGNDPIAVCEAIIEGMDLAAKCEPNIVEAKTFRWEGHFIGDPQTYRDLSFRDHLDDIDPIIKYENVLKEQGVIDDRMIVQVHDDERKKVQDIFEGTFNDAPATEEMVMDYNRLYSNDCGGEL
ncbi:MAG: thiamine pyrophosphate-dependent dehydrogenase E1 component subunit alpha [Eubacteriaceae bacterium]|jgi:TPP-dependent pyruvate/acetoin dehydrogenase alpha subunit|nr:thiamine pyrophosphate-dependent dehydrogenase E1 component subunit alpha [Eubacteriaceae bacterium]